MLCYSFFVMGSKSYSQSRTKSSGSSERMMTMDWQSLDPQVPGKQDIEHLYSFGLAFEQYICSCNLCIPKLCSGMSHSPKKSKELYSQFIGKMRSVCQLLLEGVHLCCDHHPRSEQVGTTILFRTIDYKLRIVNGFQGTSSRCQVQQIGATTANYLRDLDRPNLSSSAESFG